MHVVDCLLRVRHIAPRCAMTKLRQHDPFLFCSAQLNFSPRRLTHICSRHERTITKRSVRQKVDRTQTIAFIVHEHRHVKHTSVEIMALRNRTGFEAMHLLNGNL